MNKDLHFYIKKFRSLRVNSHKTAGKAPYQPLLLLSLLEMIEQKIVDNNRFTISPELISTFIKYRDKLGSTYYQADLSQPFYFMSRKHDSFWHLVSQPFREEVLKSGTRLTTLKLLKDNVAYGCFDNELFELLKLSSNRNMLSGVLLDKWFPEKLEQFRELIQINSFEEIRSLLREGGGALYSEEDIKDELANEIRNAAFRKNLLALYDQRCAFCRLRVVGVNGGNMVDGAHIKPFSRFRDNRYTNGLALCKNHHWAFDRGWFGISDDYQVLIPQNRIHEDSEEHSQCLEAFSGKNLFLPSQDKFCPSQDALKWHREYWMIA